MTNPLRAVLAALIVSASALLPAGALAEPASGAAYVALGDSGAATTGAADLDLAAPLRCLRSTANAPKLVARSLGLTLDDRTCSAAEIAHLSQRQAPDIAPQFDALGPATRLVTLHIGANDADMTGYILGHCHLTGCPSESEWGARIDAIAPSYAAALDDIARRAPNAVIVVDGWPTYLTDRGCPAMAGLRDADAAHIQSAFERLNTVVAREAVAHGALYVDTVAASRAFGMCADPSVRWFDPILADRTLLPYHPTPAGQRGVADLIVAAIESNNALAR
ncbi:SGNH/GDSL hydrolase family protein [Nocardia caishijiensis]|uniref:GDSL-like lipase/acylhydrolase family protein n=1 Tax=Nocardia caishijiensis TaxID=184756 RepID=A0ABQ6YPM6_9NOCA|nr:SGNH/GDSL hydrolase family protein [Nocardia caishijiensis]KAF0847772.1 GDSL-like lipase/acylhydrolase family protein [Nocardia caishijiensis]